MKFPPPALSIQGKRRNPSPHEDLFVKIGLGVFITLTSPIWIPLWILLLPFKHRRERRKREERLAQTALQAKMPPPPSPPPTDPELLRRRELARQTNKHTHPKIRPVCDTEVPRRALDCPECAANHLSGWREDADTTDGLDLPDEDFDNEEFTRREFGGESIKPQGIDWLWLSAAILVLIAFLAMFLRGIF